MGVRFGKFEDGKNLPHLSRALRKLVFEFLMPDFKTQLVVNVEEEWCDIPGYYAHFVAELQKIKRGIFHGKARASVCQMIYNCSVS